MLDKSTDSGEYLNMDRFSENFTPTIRKYLIPLSLGILGVIFLGYGLIQSIPASSEEDLVFTSASESSENVSGKVNDSEITIDVSGAVNVPGVYTILEGSRIKDAIEKAGGLSDTADEEFVEKSFNLAALLKDGSKLYIPEIGESIGSSADNSSTQVHQVVAGMESQGSININSATESELDNLPGVGPVTTGKIIDGRPYTAIEDLLNNKIVSKSLFEKIKDQISVY